MVSTAILAKLRCLSKSSVFVWPIIMPEDDFLIKSKHFNYVYSLCSCYNFSYKTPLSEIDSYRLVDTDHYFERQYVRVSTD